MWCARNEVSCASVLTVFTGLISKKIWYLMIEVDLKSCNKTLIWGLKNWIFGLKFNVWIKIKWLD